MGEPPRWGYPSPDRRAAVLEVEGGDGGWRVALTPRHATILRTLAAVGPKGLTAAGLSRALFDDDEHQVTVRAEVSRLGRVVGALVATAPHRIAEGVDPWCEG